MTRAVLILNQFLSLKQNKKKKSFGFLELISDFFKKQTFAGEM